MNNILQYPKQECCGCGICAYRCPKKLIQLTPDEEGFLYPQVTDAAACVDCGICTGVCPVHDRTLAHTVDFDHPHYAYHPEIERCRASASGGVAASLYRHFVRQGGTVFGVRYTPDFKAAEFVEVTEEGEIAPLCGSKYIKANENHLYEKVQAALTAGKTVLVIALPCEIAALKIFLRKEWPTLYTCELICHGPTSPAMLANYVETLQAREQSRVVYLNQREKNPYWKPYYLKVKLENGKEICAPFAGSEQETAFQIMKRPSCNACAFKDGVSCSDMIIGDFHGADRKTAEFHPYGVSVCFPTTEKGQELLEMLKQEKMVVGVANRARAKGNRALFAPIPALSIRQRYVKVFLKKGVHAAGKDRLVRFALKRSRWSAKAKAGIKKITRLSKRLRK